MRQKPWLHYLVKDNLKQINVNTRSRIRVYKDGTDSTGILAQTQTGFSAKQAALLNDTRLTLMRYFCT
jgi:hypothetical protein